ncbi:MAG: RES family NAD+ phosphorylase [Actinobacteria bacterium]|nr:RES family NAD+ phosphorylase [Actinomycetota bacterium]
MPLDVDPTPIQGAWFRHVPAGGEPLFRPERPADGRWQRGDVIEGFYLADSEETAWAEWYRALAELAIPPMRQLPRDLWRFDVGIARIADLSSPERLERVRLRQPAPDRKQWADYQAVGERLFAAGWAGILYSAAARPEALALCLFRTSDHLPGVRPLRPPARHDEPPIPPRGLRA